MWRVQRIPGLLVFRLNFGIHAEVTWQVICLD
jgi:hypothetical protein